MVIGGWVFFMIEVPLYMSRSFARGHIRTQDYGATKIDSPKPRKNIHLGLVDWTHLPERGAFAFQSLFAPCSNVEKIPPLQGYLAHKKPPPPSTLQ